MDVAKEANQIIKDSLELLTDENDIARFKDIPEIFNNAAGMADESEVSAALLKGWMVSQANNIVFLLWRRSILTDEIEKAYRALPSTEDALLDFTAFEKADKKVADELEEKRREYMEGQHKLDIFKAVLNGIPKDKAEAQYKAYQEKMAQAVKG